MTREGQGIDPEDTPFRPASTRWSEPTSDQDEGMLPPFVPGRPRTAAEEPGEAPSVASTPPDVGPDHEDVQASEDAHAVDVADDEPFPFETPWEDEADQAEPEVDLAELEQTLEAATPAVPEAPGSYPGPEAETHEPPHEWSHVDEESRPDGEAASGHPSAGLDSAAELADRLEGMAARLRAGEARSVEADMASPDRLTALLAGLVTGYLAGRDS